MIFLLQEADEETCCRKNPYEEESSEIWREFEREYGQFGEKLHPDEEKKEETEAGRRLYFPSDVEKYKPISDKYMEEELKIMEYRRECKDEALALFSKWFHDLWD